MIRRLDVRAALYIVPTLTLAVAYVVTHARTRGSFIFFNDTATTEIYTLSLHDALPIWAHAHHRHAELLRAAPRVDHRAHPGDRKSTRLNSSHANISYAVFCLKKNRTGGLPPSRWTTSHTAAVHSLHTVARRRLLGA